MTPEPSYIPADRRLKHFLVWVVFLLCGGYTFVDYWNYSRIEHANPGEWPSLLAGTGIAPAQYRIGVLWLANSLAHGMHLHLRHTFAAVDFVSLLAGLWCVLFLLMRTGSFRAARPLAQWSLVLLCLAIFQVYLFWTLWFQQPETLPTFLFVALSAVLCSGVMVRYRWLAALALIVVAALQATVRADVAAAFHLGMLFACVLPDRKSLPLGRSLQAITSLFCFCAVAGVQSLIAMRIFPHAHREAALLQLFANLRDPMGYLVIVFSLATYGLTCWLAVRHWRRLNGWSRGMLLGSAIHFAMYYTVGMADEVRIFLPFAMAVLPISVPLLYRWFLGAEAIPSEV